MTPKEKAHELMADFITETLGMPTLSNRQAKQCALICVEEILDSVQSKTVLEQSDYDFSNYWLEVKTEIEKI